MKAQTAKSDPTETSILARKDHHVNRQGDNSYDGNLINDASEVSDGRKPRCADRQQTKQNDQKEERRGLGRRRQPRKVPRMPGPGGGLFVVPATAVDLRRRRSKPDPGGRGRNLFRGKLGARKFPGQRSFMHHQHPVGHRQELIHLRRD
jgi:hypothetical protein